jgi:hypothetical protein
VASRWTNISDRSRACRFRHTVTAEVAGSSPVAPAHLTPTLRTPNGQKFIAVTSPQLSAPPGKLMRMSGEARDEESAREVESYPIIIRSYERVADLDDRLERIFAVHSLPPLEDFSAPGPCIARSATRGARDLVEPSLGTGFGDRCGDSEGDSGVSEGGDA